MAPGEQGPWYNLYSKVLHSFNERIYAFAYDDAAGQDSTIHIVPAKPTDQPTIDLTINKLGLSKGVPNPNPVKTGLTVAMEVPAYPPIQLVGQGGDKPLRPGQTMHQDFSSPFQVMVMGKTYSINVLTMSSLPQLSGLTFDPSKSPLTISFGGVNYPSVVISTVDKMQYHTNTGDWVNIPVGTNTFTDMQAPLLVRYSADTTKQYSIDLVNPDLSTPLPNIKYGNPGELSVSFPAQPKG